MRLLLWDPSALDIGRGTHQEPREKRVLANGWLLDSCCIEPQVAVRTKNQTPHPAESCCVQSNSGVAVAILNPILLIVQRRRLVTVSPMARPVPHSSPGCSGFLEFLNSLRNTEEELGRQVNG